MTNHSGEAALLLATLDAAESSVRTLAATMLDPARLMRIEREATLASRARVADLEPGRTLSLPAGWAEFVEVDESIDALLAHAIVRDAPLEVDVREHTHLPEVPDLPAAISSPDPAAAVLNPVETPEIRQHRPPPVREQPRSAEEIQYVRYEDPTPPAAETPAAEAHDGQADDQGYEQGYDDQGYDDQGYDDQGYEQGYDDQGYEQGYDDQGYEQGYDDQGYEQPAEPEAPKDVFDNDWSYGAETEAAAASGRFDPYANLNVAGGDRLDMDEPTERAVDTADQPSEMVEGGFERTATELSSIEDFLDDLDAEDEGEDPTQVLERPSGPAAIQLGADGNSKVLGAAQEDEDEDSLIALGDANDYGEEVDEDADGMLGVGIVEYEDDGEEYEDEEEEEEDEVSLPGAPVLTEEEVETLYQHALDVGRRDVAEGALLLGDVLDADPYHLKAHLQRGRQYLDLGDFARAFSDLVVAHDLAPTEPDVKVGLGDLYFARKDYTRAIAYFDDALHIMPRHPQALSRRGMSHYYKRNYAEALSDLEAAKAADPSIPGVDTYISRARKKLK